MVIALVLVWLLRCTTAISYHTFPELQPLPLKVIDRDGPVKQMQTITFEENIFLLVHRIKPNGKVHEPTFQIYYRSTNATQWKNTSLAERLVFPREKFLSATLGLVRLTHRTQVLTLGLCVLKDSSKREIRSIKLLPTSGGLSVESDQGFLQPLRLPSALNSQTDVSSFISPITEIFKSVSYTDYGVEFKMDGTNMFVRYGLSDSENNFMFYVLGDPVQSQQYQGSWTQKYVETFAAPLANCDFQQNLIVCGFSVSTQNPRSFLRVFRIFGGSLVSNKAGPPGIYFEKSSTWFGRAPNSILIQDEHTFLVAEPFQRVVLVFKSDHENSWNMAETINIKDYTNGPLISLNGLSTTTSMTLIEFENRLNLIVGFANGIGRNTIMLFQKQQCSAGPWKLTDLYQQRTDKFAFGFSVGAFIKGGSTPSLQLLASISGIRSGSGISQFASDSAPAMNCGLFKISTRWICQNFTFPIYVPLFPFNNSLPLEYEYSLYRTGLPEKFQTPISSKSPLLDSQSIAIKSTGSTFLIDERHSILSQLPISVTKVYRIGRVLSGSGKTIIFSADSVEEGSGVFFYEPDSKQYRFAPLDEPALDLAVSPFGNIGISTRLSASYLVQRGFWTNSGSSLIPLFNWTSLQETESILVDFAADLLVVTSIGYRPAANSTPLESMLTVTRFFTSSDSLDQFIQVGQKSHGTTRVTAVVFKDPFIAFVSSKKINICYKPPNIDACSEILFDDAIHPSSSAVGMTFIDNSHWLVVGFVPKSLKQTYENQVSYVKLYQLKGNVWTHAQTFNQSWGTNLGFSIATEGRFILLGAPNSDFKVVESPRGSAHLIKYNFEKKQWEPFAHFYPNISTPATGDPETKFGAAVSISGGHLVISYPGSVRSARANILSGDIFLIPLRCLDSHSSDCPATTYCPNPPCSCGDCQFQDYCTFSENGKVRCSCPSGFYLKNNVTCSDYDECSKSSLCKAIGADRCLNKIGSFECACFSESIQIGSSCVKNAQAPRHIQTPFPFTSFSASYSNSFSCVLLSCSEQGCNVHHTVPGRGLSHSGFTKQQSYATNLLSTIGTLLSNRSSFLSYKIPTPEFGGVPFHQAVVGTISSSKYYWCFHSGECGSMTLDSRSGSKFSYSNTTGLESSPLDQLLVVGNQMLLMASNLIYFRLTTQNEWKPLKCPLEFCSAVAQCSLLSLDMDPKKFGDANIACQIADKIVLFFNTEYKSSILLPQTRGLSRPFFSKPNYLNVFIVERGFTILTSFTFNNVSSSWQRVRRLAAGTRSNHPVAIAVSESFLLTLPTVTKSNAYLAGSFTFSSDKFFFNTTFPILPVNPQDQESIFNTTRKRQNSMNFNQHGPLYPPPFSIVSTVGLIAGHPKNDTDSYLYIYLFPLSCSNTSKSIESLDVNCKEFDDLCRVPTWSAKCDFASTTCENGKCICRPGYELPSSGDIIKCSDIDECQMSCGGNITTKCHTCTRQHEVCVNIDGGFTCACDIGFINATSNTLLTPYICEDLKECSNPKLNQCPSNSLCVELIGSYTCTCQFGLIWDSTSFSCIPNVTCPFANNCTERCIVKNDTSREYKCACWMENALLDQDGISCVCAPGYLPLRNTSRNSSLACIDRDECTESPSICLNRYGRYATCLNSPGSYSCPCFTGFSLQLNSSRQDECLPLKCVYYEWNEWENICGGCHSSRKRSRDINLEKSNGSPACFPPAVVVSDEQSCFWPCPNEAASSPSEAINWLKGALSAGGAPNEIGITWLQSNLSPGWNVDYNMTIKDKTSLIIEFQSPKRAVCDLTEPIFLIRNVTDFNLPNVRPDRISITTGIDTCSLVIGVSEEPNLLPPILGSILGFVALLLIIIFIILYFLRHKLDLSNLPSDVRYFYEKCLFENWPTEGAEGTKYHFKDIPLDSSDSKIIKNLWNILDGSSTPITGITAVMNRTLVINFINYRKIMEARMRTAPNVFHKKTWERSPNCDHRRWIINKFQSKISAFSWNQKLENGELPILAAVHGTQRAIGKKICETGFANLSSLDAGFFGKGIYFSTSVRYITTYFATQRDPVVVISWLNPGNPYPLSEQHDGPDSLMGTALQSGYNCHYVPTTASGRAVIDTSRPCYDEIVMNQESQICPAFIVSLGSLAEVAKDWARRSQVEIEIEKRASMSISNIQISLDDSELSYQKLDD